MSTPTRVLIAPDLDLNTHDSGIRRPDGSVVYTGEICAAVVEGVRNAVLEHARMGRSVCESRDGKVVWVTPEEVFARYGLDEFGRPRPESPQS